MEDRTPILILSPELAAIEAARGRLERRLIVAWTGSWLAAIAVFVIAVVLRLAQ